MDVDGELNDWPYPEKVRLDVAEYLVDLCRALVNGSPQGKLLDRQQVKFR